MQTARRIISTGMHEVQEMVELIRTGDRSKYERRKTLTLDGVELLEAVRF